MLLKVLLLLLTVVQSVLGARLRQAGPYRRRTALSSEVSPSHPTQGNARTVDAFELLLRERYANHNFDADGSYHRRDDRDSSRAYRRGDVDLGNPGAQDVARNAGVLSRMWTNTVRSNSGHSGGKLSVDVYSILALGIYTAFKAYLVYHYVTANAGEGGENRSHQALWDPTRALGRLADIDLLPRELLEEDEEGGS